jgi:hypothetical protein
MNSVASPQEALLLACGRLWQQKRSPSELHLVDVARSSIRTQGIADVACLQMSLAHRNVAAFSSLGGSRPANSLGESLSNPVSLSNSVASLETRLAFLLEAI